MHWEFLLTLQQPPQRHQNISQYGIYLFLPSLLSRSLSSRPSAGCLFLCRLPTGTCFILSCTIMRKRSINRRKRDCSVSSLVSKNPINEPILSYMAIFGHQIKHLIKLINAFFILYIVALIVIYVEKRCEFYIYIYSNHAS